MRFVGFKVLLVVSALGSFTSVLSRELEIAGVSELVGEIQVIKARHEDTFIKIARHYNLGYQELVLANPSIDPWLPGEGTDIILPTRFVLPYAPQHGIVINLPELRLYYFPEDSPGFVITHPISIGRMDWGTPLGISHIQSKALKPTWYPPESIRKEYALDGRSLARVVPPGPDNPLGDHALRLSLPGYLIHGTNKPSGVGMRVTHGCIRMFPEDIEALFSRVAIGTPVYIVNQPYKIGWVEGGFYLEAHPPLNEELSDGWTMTALTRAYVLATEKRKAGMFSWRLAELVAERGLGTPEFVSAEATTLLHSFE